VRALEAAGYDIVMIETVGVGQSEVDIVKVADTVVLVSVPGLGDDIQAIKAGIMEIGDIFVVNKADRDGADRVVREIRAMLETQAAIQRGKSVSAGPDTLAARNTELLHHGQTYLRPETLPAREECELPPVIKTVAETGEGVPELVATILAGYEKARGSGELEARRLASLKSQLKDLVGWHVMDYFLDQDREGKLESLARSVQGKKIDIYSAALELFAALMKGEQG
jgi:LAO/AO transport system kinase